MEFAAIRHPYAKHLCYPTKRTAPHGYNQIKDVRRSSARLQDAELIREAQKALVWPSMHSCASMTRRCCAGPASDRFGTGRAGYPSGSLLKAYRHIGSFRFECSFYTWIYRIVTNLCLDLLRRRKTRREDPAVIVDSTARSTTRWLMCRMIAPWQILRGNSTEKYWGRRFRPH